MASIIQRHGGIASQHSRCAHSTFCFGLLIVKSQISTVLDGNKFCMPNFQDLG